MSSSPTSSRRRSPSRGKTCRWSLPAYASTVPGWTSPSRPSIQLAAYEEDPHALNLLGLSGSVSDHAAERDLHAAGRPVEAAFEGQAPVGAGERGGPTGYRRCSREVEAV